MADDLEDLDEAVRRHDPDRWLATRFIADREARADVIALYAFNHELARVAGTVSDPLMGEIRLTWWVEALAEIFEGRPVRRHPVSLALAQAVPRRGLPRELLEAMVEARYPELDGEPPNAVAADASLMSLAATVLGQSSEAARSVAAGRLEAARDLPPRIFPVVAHLALRNSTNASPLARRLRITLAVLTGKL